MDMCSIKPRFLSKDEYIKTRPLAERTFGNEDGFLDDYYAPEGLISHGRIAVCEAGGIEADGGASCGTGDDTGDDSGNANGRRIVSMAHIVPMLMTSEDGATVPASYILCVATDPGYRHRGYMDAIFHMILPILKEEGDAYAFLCPVDTAIYRHLGFTHDWVFNPVYTDLLLADDGLTVCSTCLLNTETFSPPIKLMVKLSQDTP